MLLLWCRVSGDIDDVNVLKLRCEQWAAPTDCTEPHTPASLLKLWYRELYDPLIPHSLYDDCIESCHDADICVSLVSQLPALNRLVFCYLIRFLQVRHFRMRDSYLAISLDFYRKEISVLNQRCLSF